MPKPRKLSLQSILDGVSALARRAGGAGQERALPIEKVYEQAVMAAYTAYPQSWVTDLYLDDDGSLYLILTEAGKLYRCRITVTAGTVSLEPWEQVSIEFVPAPEAEPERRRTIILRQADGRVRWVSQSCTAVVNRVGEIDGTELFDSFVEHAERTGEYPIRQFFHAGAAFRTGQADFLARQGFVYITSGLYDDTEIARAEIAAREAEPDYWGESIGYDALEEPALVEVAPGIRLPVYRKGINREISTLPESEAAALFTRTSQEVQRAMNQRQWEAFVRLFGGDEAAARKWLEDNPDATNRAILADGLVARAADEANPADGAPPAQEAAAAAEPARENAAAAQAEADESEDEDDEQKKKKQAGEEEADAESEAVIAAAVPRGAEAETEADELELTDELLAAIAPHVAPHVFQAPEFGQLRGQIETLIDAVNSLSRQVSEANIRAEQTAGTLDERLAALESDDTERQRAWADDQPARRRTVVTYRPRQNWPTATPESEEESLAVAAASTLDGLPV